jgi:hypothetical protein
MKGGAGIEKRRLAEALMYDTEQGIKFEQLKGARTETLSKEINENTSTNNVDKDNVSTSK